MSAPPKSHEPITVISQSPIKPREIVLMQRERDSRTGKALQQFACEGSRWYPTHSSHVKISLGYTEANSPGLWPSGIGVSSIQVQFPTGLDSIDPGEPPRWTVPRGMHAQFKVEETLVATACQAASAQTLATDVAPVGIPGPYLV